jgi:nucleotide-binding universal stress UspA family protein
MIKKILVPIDGSKYSDKALAFSLDIAKKYSAKITLLCVAQPIILTSPFFLNQPLASPNTALYIKEIESAHEKMLDEAFKKTKKNNPNLEISKQLVNGRPADKIVEITKKENFDLIVMGSRGTGGIKKFFLGSVSDRVADEASCPVLLVK